MANDILYYLPAVFSGLALGFSWLAFQRARQWNQEWKTEMNRDRLTKLFSESASDELRQYSSRIKALEVEWETVYEKFDRLTKRRGGGLGGRPPKEEVIVSPDIVESRPSFDGNDLAALRQKARELGRL